MPKSIETPLFLLILSLISLTLISGARLSGFLRLVSFVTFGSTPKSSDLYLSWDSSSFVIFERLRQTTNKMIAMIRTGTTTPITMGVMFELCDVEDPSDPSELDLFSNVGTSPVNALILNSGMGACLPYKFLVERTGLFTPNMFILTERGGEAVPRLCISLMTLLLLQYILYTAVIESGVDRAECSRLPERMLEFRMGG
jgi:hypothetical protein